MNVEMKGISKSFGANLVLKQVDFSVQGGEVCALLGENGAGKSTLMNILGGVIPKDSGKIIIDGKEVDFPTPASSLEAGIAFIHQELNLVNDLSIYENMFIGREIKGKHGLLDQEKMIAETNAIFKRMGIALDPKTMVRDLDASYKQIVEISRAMMMRASVIIMDEPTTSLTEPEIERVFAFMRALQKEGVGIVFISHKLGEVLEICTDYSVLRDGVLVAKGKIDSSVTTELLAFHMVGRKVGSGKFKRNAKVGSEVLSLSDLTSEPFYRHITLSVRKGEILGITGLLGDGRSELFQSVFGAGRRFSGTVELEGKRISCSDPWDSIALGIAYVPRNRKENGIIKDMDILENGSIVVLDRLSRHGIIDGEKETELFQKQVRDLSIKMGKETDSITSLSGGNQQKVVLAKWLSTGPKVLILDNPTQGVDVGAKEEIYDIILRLAESGVAVIVLSSEAQEIMRVCDRTFVMFHGSLMGELEGDAMQEHAIMLLATGVKNEQ